MSRTSCLLFASVLACGMLFFINPHECRPTSTNDDDGDDDSPRDVTQQDLINNGMNIDETQAIPVLIEVPDNQSMEGSSPELSLAESAPPAHYKPSKQVHKKKQPDLKAAASHHKHHGHGAKGWLDMGAWTAHKGAFGWYDKHPVGKGK